MKKLISFIALFCLLTNVSYATEVFAPTGSDIFIPQGAKNTKVYVVNGTKLEIAGECSDEAYLFINRDYVGVAVLEDEKLLSEAMKLDVKDGKFAVDFDVSNENNEPEQGGLPYNMESGYGGTDNIYRKLVKDSYPNRFFVVSKVDGKLETSDVILVSIDTQNK